MGGGMLRTAGKAAASASHLASPIVDQMAVAAGARRAASRAAPFSAGIGVTSVPVLSTSSSVNEQVVATHSTQHKPAARKKVEEWELAGGEEEEMFDQTSRTPRLVFGPVPTFEEAKEATVDLKDTIDKAYFSFPTKECGDTTYVCNDSSTTSSGGLLSQMNSTIASSTSHPSAPKHVLQAFSLLQDSPEAQCVVASLASDKNVWDAVMNNKKVMEFYKSHQMAVCEKTENGDRQNELKSIREKQPGKHENIFTSLMANTKKKILNMVSAITDLIENLSTLIGIGSENVVEEGTEAKYNDGKTMAIGASFMVLAIATIVVVLFKRA